MEKDKEEYIFAVMGVDNSVSIERPEIPNFHVIFWKRANIVVPWRLGLTAREAIIEWAMGELKHSG